MRSDLGNSMSLRQAHSFCRICAGCCGVIVEIDDLGRAVSVKPDKANARSNGFICAKGVQLSEAHNDPSRLLHPLKRADDGTFHRIELERALDEIGAKLSAVIDRHGPTAVAGFRGTQNYYNVLASRMMPDWLRALGSPAFFSTQTIDQSAKWVTADRLGRWNAGRHLFEESEVAMIIGGNPLVTLAVFGSPMADPIRSYREAKARGLKLIVIDPRRTETARLADVFLQPRPGEDPTIAAGLLNIILKEGWHDQDFCAQYVKDLDGLRRAVETFTPDYVAQRADVPVEMLLAAAKLFAFDSKRGCALTSTGPSMAPRSNLSEHLYECLNVICGRFVREGERVANPGVLSAPIDRTAEVIAPTRSWEQGYQSRTRNTGTVNGEMMSAVLP
jgi:anaerobic selenocysteine-containing dehydrogenase